MLKKEKNTKKLINPNNILNLILFCIFLLSLIFILLIKTTHVNKLIGSNGHINILLFKIFTSFLIATYAMMQINFLKVHNAPNFVKSLFKAKQYKTWIISSFLGVIIGITIEQFISNGINQISPFHVSLLFIIVFLVISFWSLLEEEFIEEFDKKYKKGTFVLKTYTKKQLLSTTPFILLIIMIWFFIPKNHLIKLCFPSKTYTVAFLYKKNSKIHKKSNYLIKKIHEDIICEIKKNNKEEDLSKLFQFKIFQYEINTNKISKKYINKFSNLTMLFYSDLSTIYDNRNNKHIKYVNINLKPFDKDINSIFIFNKEEQANEFSNDIICESISINDLHQGNYSFENLQTSVYIYFKIFKIKLLLSRKNDLEPKKKTKIDEIVSEIINDIYENHLDKLLNGPNKLKKMVILSGLLSIPDIPESKKEILINNLASIYNPINWNWDIYKNIGDGYYPNGYYDIQNRKNLISAYEAYDNALSTYKGYNITLKNHLIRRAAIARIRANKDISNAKNLLLEIYPANDDYPYTDIYLGISLFKLGKFDRAIEIFNEICYRKNTHYCYAKICKILCFLEKCYRNNTNLIQVPHKELKEKLLNPAYELSLKNDNSFNGITYYLMGLYYKSIGNIDSTIINFRIANKNQFNKELLPETMDKILTDINPYL